MKKVDSKLGEKKLTETNSEMLALTDRKRPVTKTKKDLL